MKHYLISIYINTTGEVNVDIAVEQTTYFLENLAKPNLEVEDVHFEEVLVDEPTDDPDIGLEKIEKN